MIHFVNPEWLILLALLPFLAFWKGRRGVAAAVEYSSVEIVRSVSGARLNRAGRILTGLRLFALLFFILALARPQFGRTTSEIESSGIDLVLAVDVSGSMEALDFKLHGSPANRLDVVKNVVARFIEERPNDRIAIVAFAGRPYLVSPLTLDHDWLLKNMDRMRIGMVEDGTAIGSALVAGVNRLRNQPSKSKIVILLTDGVNNAGSVSPLTAADAARAMNMRVYTIGAGVRGQAPLPVTDAFGRRRLVMAQVDVDEETLQKIADTTGGKYFRATDTDSLSRIYQEIDKMEKTTHHAKRFENYRDVYVWFLILGLIFLGLEILGNATRWRRLP